MSTLVEIVREKSGAPAAIADTRIVEALMATSVRVEHQALTWKTRPDGEYTRTAQAAIGRYLVEASDVEGADNVVPPVLHDAGAAALEDLTIDQEGLVTAAGTDDLPTAYMSARVFDVHAAAAEIVGVRIAALAGTVMDFDRGDQSFKRSQIMPQLEKLQRDLSKKRVPVRRGEVAMSDQAATTC